MSDYSHISDELLIDLIRSGDRNALSELYGRFHKEVKIQAYMFSNNLEDAEDAVHDVFISLLSGSQTSSISNVRGYLYTAVFNRLRNINRKSVAHKLYEDYAHFFPDSDAADPYDNKEFMSVLNEAIDKIPLANDRKIVVMNILEGVAPVDISRKTNMNHQVVRNKLSQSLKLIRIRLLKYFHLPCLIILFF